MTHLAEDLCRDFSVILSTERLKDTVPVNVDAIIFWFVHDARRRELAAFSAKDALRFHPK
jgi:hypothetical protein